MKLPNLVDRLMRLGTLRVAVITNKKIKDDD